MNTVRKSEFNVGDRVRIKEVYLRENTEKYPLPGPLVHLIERNAIWVVDRIEELDPQMYHVLWQKREGEEPVLQFAHTSKDGTVFTESEWYGWYVPEAYLIPAEVKLVGKENQS